MKYKIRNQEKHNIEQHKAKRYLIIDFVLYFTFYIKTQQHKTL